MRLVTLTDDTLADIHARWFMKVFPDSELRSMKTIRALMGLGHYYAYGLDDDGQLVACILLWADGAEEHTVIDYILTDPSRRNNGYGSEILRRLIAATPQYVSYIVETRAPESVEIEQEEECHRRIKFYQKNGFRRLNYDTMMYENHFYTMMYGSISDEEAMKSHQEITSFQFISPHNQMCIQIPWKPGDPIYHPEDDGEWD